MLSNAEIPFTIPIYLFFNSKLKKFFKNTCFLNEIPLSDKKSIVINSKEEIKNYLEKSLDEKFRLELLKNIKQHFKEYIENPAKEVVEILNRA